MDLFVSNLENKSRLTQLIAPYIASDKLLSALGRYCPVLEYLDASGSELVTDRGVSSLYKKTVGWDTCPTDLTFTLKWVENNKTKII